MSLLVQTKVTSCRQVGVNLAPGWPANNPDNSLRQSQMQKLQLLLHVQAQENRSQGVGERYTILHPFILWNHAEALNSHS